MTTDTIHGDLTDEVDEAPEAVDTTDLERLVAHLGEAAILPTGEWARLLGIGGGAFYYAEKNRHLDETTRSENRVSVTGIQARDLLAWVRKQGIPYELSPTAQALVSMTKGEAIAAAFGSNAGPTTAERAAKLLGVEQRVIEQAARDGEIRTGQVCHHAGYLPPEALLAWIDRASINPKWSIPLAQQVANQRAFSEPEHVDPAPQPFDKLLESLEQATAAQSREEADARESCLVAYREILARRDNPKKQDQRDLVDLCVDLGFTRSDVERDILALVKLAELEQAAADKEAAHAELEAVAREKEIEAKRAEAALLALRKRETFAWRRNAECVNATAAIAELRQARPHLFGGRP